MKSATKRKHHFNRGESPRAAEQSSRSVNLAGGSEPKSSRAFFFLFGLVALRWCCAVLCSIPRRNNGLIPRMRSADTTYLRDEWFMVLTTALPEFACSRWSLNHTGNHRHPSLVIMSSKQGTWYLMTYECCRHGFQRSLGRWSILKV